MQNVKYAILAGAQGVGKGTLGKALQDRLPGRFFTIETGALLREIAKKDPECEVARLMREGLLVSDELIFHLVTKQKDKLLEEVPCDSNGGPIWIFLDGVPRNEAQAKKMREYLGDVLEYAFILDADLQLLKKRTINRRVCQKCGQTYNTEGAYAPKQPGLCDRCGEELIQRKDDTEEALEKRWSIYFSQTRPAILSMEEYGVKVVVCENNNGEAEEEILRALFPDGVTV